MNPPRFAIACPNFHPRICGVGDQSFRLALELRRRGYAAEIFSREPAVTHPEAMDVPVHAVPGRLPMVIAEGIRRRIVGGGFTHLLLQYVPHIWGASRFGSLATVWLAAAARQAGLDVTVVAHELFINPGARPDLLAGAALQRLQMLAVLRAAHRVLVTTDTRVKVIPFWRAARGAGRLGVLRIGPNAEPRQNARPPGRARLGIFSGVGKPLDVVLGAFEVVWRRRPEAELVLIGDLGGENDPKSEGLRRQIDAHPARAGIRLTGRVDLDRAAAEIADLDVYLFPMVTGANTRSSTLPIALGCGVPVVAISSFETDTQLFHDRENVVFASALDGRAFGEAALALLEQPALAQRVSAGARSLYDERLSWPVIGDALLGTMGLR